MNNLCLKYIYPPTGKRFLAVLGLLFFVVLSFGTATAHAADSSVIEYWNFNGCRAAASINPSNTISNVYACVSGISGLTGDVAAAIHYTADATANLSYSSNLALDGGVSFSYWHKNTSGSGNDARTKADLQGTGGGLMLSEYNSNQFDLPTGATSCMSESGNLQSSAVQSTVQDGNWHNIVFVSTYDQGKLYYDGNLFYTCDYLTHATLTGLSGLKFNYGNWTGAVDDVAVFNKPLTATEVQSVYTADPFSGDISFVPPLTITYQSFEPTTKNLILAGTCQSATSSLNQIFIQDLPDTTKIVAVNCSANAWAVNYTNTSLYGTITIQVVDEAHNVYTETTQDFGSQGERIPLQPGLYFPNSPYTCVYGQQCRIPYTYYQDIWHNGDQATINYVGTLANPYQAQVFVATTTIVDTSDPQKQNGNSYLLLDPTYAGLNFAGNDWEFELLATSTTGGIYETMFNVNWSNAPIPAPTFDFSHVCDGIDTGELLGQVECAIKSALTEATTIIFMPTAGSMNYFQDNYTTFKGAFPFNTYYQLMDTINTAIGSATSTSAGSFSMPFIHTNGSFYMLPVVASSSMTNLLGATNVSTFRTTIGYLFWILVAFLIYLTVRFSK